MAADSSGDSLTVGEIQQTEGRPYASGTPNRLVNIVANYETMVMTADKDLERRHQARIYRLVGRRTKLR